MMGIKKKLSITAFSLALALTVSALFGLLALVALLGPGQEIIKVLSSLFVGYEASAAGFFVGIVWGFFVGGIMGLMSSWLYNKML